MWYGKVSRKFFSENESVTLTASTSVVGGFLCKWMFHCHASAAIGLMWRDVTFVWRYIRVKWHGRCITGVMLYYGEHIISPWYVLFDVGVMLYTGEVLWHVWRGGVTCWCYVTSWRDDLENLSPNTFQLFGFTTYLGSYLPTLCLSSTHASTYLTLILMHTSLSFSPIHILRYTSLFICISLKHLTLLMHLSSVNVSTQDFFFEVIFLSLRRYLGTGTSHSAVHDLLLFMSNFIRLPNSHS